MRRLAWTWSALAALQVALLASSRPIPGLGTRWWEHLASLAAVLAGAALLRRQMQDRAFLAFGVLATSVLATASGFYLLYWKEGIRVDGHQDWGVFWHVAWSWAAAVFFWQHTWVNRVAFTRFWREAWRRGRPWALHAGAYLALVASLLWTWGPGKALFTVENYVPLSFWSWLACTTAAYASWLALRRRDAPAQRSIRGHVDVVLVPIAALATLSGVPLLWWDPQLDALGLKYASKFWHVWPSVAFSVLVFVHAAQAWGQVRAHWRRIGVLPGPGAQDTVSPPSR